MDPIVIVGTGLAGYCTARELRKLDGEAPLVIVSADGAGFYSKPMLSNALASGKTAQQLLNKAAAAMREELRATLIERTSVAELDPAAHRIRAGGQHIAYSKLVLALGADPIRLPLAGNGAVAVLSVNDLDDYARFRAAVEGGRRVAVLGAGLIGCEFANDLAIAGYSVDVADIAAQPLGRLLPPEAAAGVRDALAALGVRWHLGKKATAVERSGASLVLCFEDGSKVETDIVLSAVGLAPRTALARAAGLSVNRGIVVDRFLRSSDPDIYALGDCAEVEGQVLPFVMPIMHAARALASTLAGNDKALAYPPMPVVVKTPALPTVVCPPAPGSTGSWQVELEVGGTVARYVDGAGKLLGFALTGPACARKSQMLKEMPPAS
jgi:rubredoxin---NAD+ reductase